METRLNWCAVVGITALCFVCSVAFGQQQAATEQVHSGFGDVHKLAPGGAAPRTADGHPDLSGVWFPNSAGVGIMAADPVDRDARLQFDPKVTPEAQPSFQPWALAKLKSMTITEASLADAGVNCDPEGVPGMFLMSSHPYPIKIVQTTKEFIQMNEFRNNFRIVPLDGRPHQKDPDPTYTGDAVGHWEGDTLVIDVIGLDERSHAMRGAAFFHSDQEHVIERISRPSMNYLVYEVTIEDPKVLTKPWTSAPRRWSLSRYNETLQEFYCTNEQDSKEFRAVGETAEGKKSK
jgi:hypothetical protein